MAFPFLPKLAEAHAFAQDPGNTASKYYLRNRLQIDLLLTTSLLLNTVHTTFYVILCKCRQCFHSISNSRTSLFKKQVNFVAHNLARASTFNASTNDFNCIPFAVYPTALN